MSLPKEVRRLLTKNQGRDSIIGTAIHHSEFRSRYDLLPRNVTVWLPPSYAKKRGERYPVLYMHDGQNLFDPKTSYAGVDWRVDETITSLVKGNKLDECIVVGVHNTPDRLAEYSISEKGIWYQKFLVEELKPFIDSNYRTRVEAEHNAVMGSSMGGLCSLTLVWQYPEVFGMAGCLSSSFYYSDNAVFKMIESDYSGKKKIRVYLDSGEDGKYDAQKMFLLLSQKGMRIGDDLDYYYDRGAQHNESYWADRLARPLLFFFERKD